MSKNLFQDFEEVSAKQWKQKIQYDLKGADYNETLIWKTNHGVDVKPFYNAEEMLATSVPAPSSSWDICEKIYVASVEISNKRAINVLSRGAESLWFIIPSEEVAPEKLFAEINLEKTPIHLEFEFLSDTYFSKFKNYFSGKKNQVHFHIDIIGNLARSGNFYQDLKQDHEKLDKIASDAPENTKFISIDAALYQNAGANIPQQLAYALSHANEYLNHFFNSEKTISAENFQPIFKVSVGSNYFFEIAKLRALRKLYSAIASEYNIKTDCFILAQPTKRNKTLYDYNVNLLRTTTECMSAVLGGADSVCNMPYDALYHKNNEFGDRIARNQLLVLKHESYFEKAVNAAEGAYYIETLTTQFAEKALEIFKEIEKGDGFQKQLKEGIIQKKINESAEKEQKQFDNGEIILLGSNKYENPQDKMKHELELYPFLKQNPRKTLIQPILERRLAEKMEQERLVTES